MWFKNTNVYQLHGQQQLTADALNDMLAADGAQPLGNADATRYGWAKPAGRASELHLHEVQGHRLFSLLKQERILPGSVVKDAVSEKVAEIEDREGRTLTKKEKSAIKEQVTEDLLPRAFVRTTKIDAWWDTQRQRIIINSASRARCEELLDLLRQTLGTLSVTPLATQTLPVRAMTEWLNDTSKRPANLELGDVITLKAKGDDGVWKGRQVDPDSDEIQQMLETGRQATELGIKINDTLTCVLNDSLTLKSLRFGDKLIEQADATDDGDDPIARVETDFYLMANALAEALDSLIGMLGGVAEREIPVEIGHRPDDAHPGEQVGSFVEDEPLLKDAIALANQEGGDLPTAAKLQRHFRIAYDRAQRLQAMLAKANPSGQAGA